jgi:hypothetical protein
MDKKIDEIEATTKDWVRLTNEDVTSSILKDISVDYEITRSDRGILIKFIDKVSGTSEQEFWEVTFIDKVDIDVVYLYLRHITYKLMDRIEDTK